MFNDEYIISLTTVPKRLNMQCLIQSINSILNQSIQLKVILNIPLEYKKWDIPIIIPESLYNNENVIIHRTKQDYGPATKLLGALEYLETHSTCVKYVITIDDDIEYLDNCHIEKLINHSKKYPNYTISIESLTLTHEPYRSSNGIVGTCKGFVDIPAGFTGVLYPIFLFDKTQIHSDGLPEGIFNDDDAYFGILMNRLNIPIYVPEIPVEFGLNINELHNNGSAVQDNVSLHRVENESIIYNYAIKNGLLPSKYRIQL